jgi:NAD/NADP transhydrogenase alpha subunit
MRTPKLLESMLIGGAAVVFVGTRVIPGHDQNGPVLAAATHIVAAAPGSTVVAMAGTSGGGLEAEVQSAVDKLVEVV